MPDMKRKILIILFATIAIIACNKNDQTVVTPTVTTNTDNAIISAALNLPTVPFDYVNLNNKNSI